MAAKPHNTTPSDRPGPERLKVFVSYSRADALFVDELVAGLEYDGGVETLIDRQSIQEGEAWKARIGALIKEADSMVLVLSPAWLNSPICNWEIE